MPYDWRTEADPPSAYCTDGPATTVFMCYEHVFDGVQNAIITTYAFNANAVRQIISAWNDEPLRYRLGTLTGWWTDWVTIATSTKPQEYDLPLANGVIMLYQSFYRKNQMGDIAVRASLALPNGDASEIHVATLPSGYRPSIDTEIPVTLSDSEYVAHSSTAKVSVSGDIKVQRAILGLWRVYFNWTL